ncbi:MAG: hypothetical protein AAGB05_01240 [Pseudomonadota bacterium]
MRLKTTLAALALAALPTVSFAMGCNWDHTPASTATVCGEGQTYDVTTGTCVTQATS